MCLGVPGKVLELAEDPFSLGKVAFGEVVKAVSLALVPGVAVGEFVMVHAGTALEVIDEELASRTLAVLRQLSDETGTPLA
ncbi:MAG: hypothetical protein H6Q00_2462 [Holophagaceae bacterium]|nr:hypothetical protein [Holophagaceae bacterium]